MEVLNSFYNPGATLLQQAPAAEGCTSCIYIVLEYMTTSAEEIRFVL